MGATTPGGGEPLAMSFENDAFISYAHIDDQPLVEGQKGWVSSFHRALEIRLAQLMGRPPSVWRDPKLSGNDIFSDRLVQRLPRVALLVCVLSPRYVRSDWCMRELHEFIKATSATGGLRIGDKARVFKVVKTPVPLGQQPEEFRSLLGYDFYTVDPEIGRARELSQTADAEAQRLYWLKLDDLAHDIAESLERMDRGAELEAPASAEAKTVYLAETSFDMRDARDVVRRELLGHGHVVLPDRPLPLVGPECEEAVHEQPPRSCLSIHLIGRNYGLIPEGARESVVVIQNELAIERAQGGDFARLVWLPPGFSSEEEKQLQFVDRLQTDVRIQAGADILQTPLEDFKSAVLERLQPPPPAPAPAAEAAAPAAEGAAEPAEGLVRIYMIYDQRDGDAPQAVEDYLFREGYEVIVPVFEGDEADVRREHEESLAVCDGVLLYYGTANELWLRRKLREILKSAAFGRKKPISGKAILVAPPGSATKQRLRTHEALVIDQQGGFDPAPLRPFLSQLRIA
jgi:hypothetical protein